MIILRYSRSFHSASTLCHPALGIRASTTAAGRQQAGERVAAGRLLPYPYFNIFFCNAAAVKEEDEPASERVRTSSNVLHGMVRHYYLSIHTSQFQSLCSMKSSSQMLQNLPYFIYTKPKVVFSIFHFMLLYIFT